MPSIYIPLAVVGALTAFAIVIGTLVVIRPMLSGPHQPGDWLAGTTAGLAAALAGVAGVVVGLRADEYTLGTWTQVVVGGAVAVIGLLLVIIGVASFEPDPDAGEPAETG